MKPTEAQANVLRKLRTPKATKGGRHGTVPANVLAGLLRRGWARKLSVQELDGTEYFLTTPRGELALRVDDVYLEIDRLRGRALAMEAELDRKPPSWCANPRHAAEPHMDNGRCS